MKHCAIRDLASGLALSLAAFTGAASLSGCEEERASPPSFSAPATNATSKKWWPAIAAQATEIRPGAWLLPSVGTDAALVEEFERLHPNLKVIGIFCCSMLMDDSQKPSFRFAPELAHALSLKEDEYPRSAVLFLVSGD